MKEDFRVNGREWLKRGLKKFGGKPFRTLTDFGPITILPIEYAQEIRNHEDLIHTRAVAKMVHAEYPGIEGFYEFAFGGGVIQDCVKLKLTQLLATVTEPLSEETALTLQEYFTDNKEWHTIPTHSTLLGAVARVSSRLFLGDKLCRNREWLNITTTYTYKVVGAVHEINSWPALLRPWVVRFLPRVRELQAQVAKAQKLLGGVLEERRQLEARGEKPEYNDAIEWFKQVANGRKYNAANVQLTLSFVAIHTTADAITQILFDLAQNPEYIKPLREEVIRVLGEQGWKKTSLYNMKMLDSVLKESQRMRPINETSLQRLAISNVKLSDGTVLPRGGLMAVASSRRYDPKYYPNPEKFDGFRFLKMREEPGKENVAQYVSTSPDHLGFGHGNHACPGRFFASNEIKIIFCHILLKYDWRLVPGKNPETMIHGFNLAADHRTPLEIRRREPEIDIDNLHV